MKYNVYSVRDIHTGFGAPILDQADASAIRGFAYGMHNTNPVMGFAPSDFDLYRLGTFDIKSGQFDLLPVPELVISGPQAYNNLWADGCGKTVISK